MSSAKATEYWQALDRPVLVSREVHAPWGGDPNAVAFTNKAFELYYRARRGAEAVRDAAQRDAMVSALEACAGDRSGTGVSDLRGAFEHLEADGDDHCEWWDGEIAEYDGASTNVPTHRTIWPRSVVGPRSAVAFVQALDSSMQTLAASAQRHDDLVGELIERIEAPDRDWTSIGMTLGRIVAIARETSPYLWLAPEIGRLGSLSGTFVRACAKLDGYARKIVVAGAVGASIEGGPERAALESTLGYVQVLGCFYAAALDMTPGLRMWCQHRVQRRRDQLEAALRGKEPRERPGRPPVAVRADARRSLAPLPRPVEAA
jgi:hypothetical protein